VSRHGARAEADEGRRRARAVACGLGKLRIGGLAKVEGVKKGAAIAASAARSTIRRATAIAVD
jgi:hypothetical protein